MICLFCRQKLKLFRLLWPVYREQKLVGFSHPGCGLRGSKNNSTAAARRDVVTGRKQVGV